MSSDFFSYQTWFPSSHAMSRAVCVLRHRGCICDRRNIVPDRSGLLRRELRQRLFDENYQNLDTPTKPTWYTKNHHHPKIVKSLILIQNPYRQESLSRNQYFVSGTFLGRLRHVGVGKRCIYCWGTFFRSKMVGMKMRKPVKVNAENRENSMIFMIFRSSDRHLSSWSM